MMKEASPRARERLWIIEHFRVLPTDERFLRLTDEQIAVIINAWLAAPGDDELKRVYWTERDKKTKPMPDDSDLSGIGWSPEEIEAIKAELKHGR